MKTVAFVPIKLHSERVPGKNIKPLGKHVLAWYIFNALSGLKRVDKIYVYCSDERIKEYIPANITFLKRDPILDGNTVKGFDIYERFINDVDADVYVLSHATSPFVKTESIQTALDHVLNGDNDSAVSAMRVQTFLWNSKGPMNYDPNDIPRTQDLEPVFAEQGAFYIFHKEIFTKHHRRVGFRPYIHELTDIEAIDIDEPAQFEFAKLLAKTMNI